MQHTIRLPDLDGILPLYLAIHYTGQCDEWNITNIELYSDPDYKTLLADDIQLEKLPQSSQDSVIAALNSWDFERRLAANYLRIFGELPEGVTA